MNSSPCPACSPARPQAGFTQYSAMDVAKAVREVPGWRGMGSVEELAAAVAQVLIDRALG